MKLIANTAIPMRARSTFGTELRPVRPGVRPIVWSIAGSDSGAGAGLQADLKALQAFGVHGCTAVASIIGFEDLSKLGSVLANATFQPFLIYGLVALAYFALCWPLSLYASHLEKKLYAAR